MAKNKIQDLRDHLFETIELLKDNDPKTSISIEKAKAIADVAQCIINSAKLEIDFIRVIDHADGFYPSTGFIEMEKRKMIDK